VVAIGVVAVLVLAIGGWWLTRDGADRTSTTSTVSTGPDVTSPYDLIEADAAVDLGTLTEAKFASLLLDTSEGLTSYMIAAGQPSFVALADAVAASERVDGPAPATGSTLTFVMEDRVTVTFDLDIAAGVVGREGAVWRPAGDLAALVGDVTAKAEEFPE